MCGGLIDSAALVAALKQGEIGAAAVDVLTEEPPSGGDPLLDYDGPNLIVTPHIAWATTEARKNRVVFERNNNEAMAGNELVKNGVAGKTKVFMTCENDEWKSRPVYRLSIKICA